MAWGKGIILIVTKKGKEANFVLKDGETVEQLLERAKLALPEGDEIFDWADNLEKANRIMAQEPQ